jgi:hypothetical protein
MGETLVSQKKKKATTTLQDVVDDFHTGGALENGCVRRDLGHRFLDRLAVQSDITWIRFDLSTTRVISFKITL